MAENNREWKDGEKTDFPQESKSLNENSGKNRLSCYLNSKPIKQIKRGKEENK